MTIAPDGSRIAYSSHRVGDVPESRRIYVRHLDEIEAIVLRGTEGGGASPFFSPDGESIGFVGGTEGRMLKRVSALGGGAPVPIATFDGTPFGMEWAVDDTILFGLETRPGLLRIPAGGGEVEQLTTIDQEAGEIQHGRATVLPDGDTVLFTAGLNGSTQHFILKGRGGMYAERDAIRFHGGGEGGGMGSVAARGISA